MSTLVYTQFTDGLVTEIKAHLRNPNRPRPNIMNRFAFTHRNNRVYHERKEVVPQSKVDDYLRVLMYSPKSTAPLSRDSLHKYCADKYWGISRRAIMRFLQAQPSYTKLAKRPPKDKGDARFFQSYKGLLGVDIVYLDKEAYPPKFLPTPTGIAKKKHYVLTAVDALTHYAFVRYLGTSMGARRVLANFKEIEKEYKKVFGYFPKIIASDRGSEFVNKEVWKPYMAKRGYGLQYVKLVAYVEQFNAQLQKTLVMLATGMRTGKKLSTVLPNAVKRCNNGHNMRMKRQIKTIH